ncbi:MAG: endonuclease/exonuclease/phosphatase family protein [Rubellimicrobium sp.]|nr:endonuclease/exonuclease/phosphatase family protein [Rubellimicrobium sp.]
MRLATYNVEWFDRLFDDQGRLLDDTEWSGRQDVTREDQIAALGVVFRALDADGIMVIEAPEQSRRRDTVRALETFAARFRLRARRAVIGFGNQTQQEIAFLFDPDLIAARHDPRGEPTGKKGERGAPRFDGVFRIDLDQDGRDDLVVWSKPPLELEVTTKGGTDLRLIGVHAKSKAPHGAHSPQEAMRLSIDNRRKQLAQCQWLRGRIDQHLEVGQSLVVMGDFNDGPGLDEYERLFGRSGVEIVAGNGDEVPLYDPNVMRALTRRFTAPPTTARFALPDGEVLSALLDYIMISPDLRAHLPRWLVWHPHDNRACVNDGMLRDALLTASDHFPVTLDIEI